MFCCQAIFFVEYFLPCHFLPSFLPFRSVLFYLFSTVLVFHLATQVCLYSAHQILFYFAGPVLLLAICFGCVLLGRHQGHTWSTPGYPCPFASSVCPGFPIVLSLPAVLYCMGIRAISVLHTLVVL
jgi:hypothetical protein